MSRYSRYADIQEVSEEDEDDSFKPIPWVLFALFSTLLAVFLLSFDNCMTSEISKREVTDPAPLNKDVMYMTKHYDSSFSECGSHWYRYLSSSKKGLT